MQSSDSTGLKWGIGEIAIAAFEQIHHLNVTVHDIVGTLGPFLAPNRFHHRSPICVAVKAQRPEACVHYDIVRVRRELVNLPEGRIHICHAGVVECVVPVFENEKLKWVLFAGPRFPAPDLALTLLPQKTAWLKPCWAKGAALPAAVREDEAQLILEHLRQLAVRLNVWVREMKLNSTMTRSVADGSASGSMTSVGSMNLRRVIILRFIEEKYSEPMTLSMLARRLCLSESRTSHVVQRTCHASFRELVIRKRLGVAVDLLRQSGMSVLEVAMASGFEDVTHFHRLFRRRIGTSPGRFRISGQS